jgi:hypothetical protein
MIARRWERGNAACSMDIGFQLFEMKNELRVSVL